MKEVPRQERITLTEGLEITFPFSIHAYEKKQIGQICFNLLEKHGENARYQFVDKGGLSLVFRGKQIRFSFSKTPQYTTNGKYGVKISLFDGGTVQEEQWSSRSFATFITRELHSFQPYIVQVPHE